MDFIPVKSCPDRRRLVAWGDSWFLSVRESQATSAAALLLLRGASSPPGQSSGLCPKEKHICLCVVLVTSGAQGLFHPDTLPANLWFWFGEPDGPEEMQIWHELKHKIYSRTEETKFYCWGVRGHLRPFSAVLCEWQDLCNLERNKHWSGHASGRRHA